MLLPLLLNNLLGDGTTPPTPTPVDTSSGGWHWASYYERQLAQRRNRRREREEAIEEATDEVTAEIAQLLHKQERIDEERAHLERLRAMARDNASQDLPPRVLEAIARAQGEATASALRALDREIRRWLEEEEMAVLMMMLND